MKFQNKLGNGKIALGGLVTLIGDHLAILHPNERPVQAHFKYDYKHLSSASVNKYMNRSYYHIYGQKNAMLLSCRVPCHLGHIMRISIYISSPS